MEIKMSAKEDSTLLKKDSYGRWMYDNQRLSYLLGKMATKKKCDILTKALEIINEKGCSVDYAIARALGCGYDDAGYYWSEKEICV